MNSNDSHDLSSSAGAERYEPPRVIEDLPLETFSLACAKSDGVCTDPGEPGSTS